MRWPIFAPEAPSERPERAPAAPEPEAPPPGRGGSGWLGWLIALGIVGGLGLGRVALCVAQDRSDTGRRGRAGSARSRGGTPTGRRGDDRHRRPRQVVLTGHRHRYAARHRHRSDPDQRAAARRSASRRARWSHKGDFLAQIDPRPYQVTLEQAQGALRPRHRPRWQAGQVGPRRATPRSTARTASPSSRSPTSSSWFSRTKGWSIGGPGRHRQRASLNLTYCRIVSRRHGPRRAAPRRSLATTSRPASSTGLVVVTQDCSRSR